MGKTVETRRGKFQDKATDAVRAHVLELSDNWLIGYLDNEHTCSNAGSGRRRLALARAGGGGEGVDAPPPISFSGMAAEPLGRWR